MYADAYIAYCLSFCPFVFVFISMDLRGLIQIKNE